MPTRVSTLTCASRGRAVSTRRRGGSVWMPPPSSPKRASPRREQMMRPILGQRAFSWHGSARCWSAYPWRYRTRPSSVSFTSLSHVSRNIKYERCDARDPAGLRVVAPNLALRFAHRVCPKAATKKSTCAGSSACPVFSLPNPCGGPSRTRGSSTHGASVHSMKVCGNHHEATRARPSPPVPCSGRRQAAQ